LLSRLDRLFGPYFDQPIDLQPLLGKLVTESAVAPLLDGGRVLYNPSNMLFLHLPEGWENGNEIRVATLEDLQEILKTERPANPLLAAYGKGFEEFALLSELMKAPDSKDTLEIIWASLPRTVHDKTRMRYLLLRPLQQAMAIRHQSPSCKKEINRFIDDV